MRPRSFEDHPIPSGNSSAAYGLERLAAFTGERDYERRAVEVLGILHQAAARHPQAFGHLLQALRFHFGPRREVALVGEPLDELAAVVRSRFRPTTVVAGMRPRDTRAPEVVPLLAGREPVDGRPAAYVCENFACRMPVTEPAELERELARPARSSSLPLRRSTSTTSRQRSPIFPSRSRTPTTRQPSASHSARLARFSGKIQPSSVQMPARSEACDQRLPERPPDSAAALGRRHVEAHLRDTAVHGRARPGCSAAHATTAPVAARHQPAFGQMPAVPFLPRRRALLEGRLAGGDPLRVDLAHRGPVGRRHRARSTAP